MMLLLSCKGITSSSVVATKHRLIKLEELSWQLLMLDRDGLLVNRSSSIPAIGSRVGTAVVVDLTVGAEEGYVRLLRTGKRGYGDDGGRCGEGG